MQQETSKKSWLSKFGRYIAIIAGTSLAMLALTIAIASHNVTEAQTVNTGTVTINVSDLQNLLSQLQSLQTQVNNLTLQVQTLINNSTTTATTTPGTGTTTPPTGTTTPPVVTFTGTITPSSITVMPGSSVDFNGRNFGIEEPVTVTNNGNFVETAHADGGGNFSTGAIMIPFNATGTQVFSFSGSNSGITASSTVMLMP